MNNNPYKLHPLIHAASLVEDRLGDELAPIGIKPRQARVLNVLHLMGAATQGELAREFEVTAASMSTMTTRLITGGFIKRTVDDTPARRVELKLTAKGIALIDPINAAWREVDRLMEQAIGQANAHSLARLSAELRNTLGGRVAGAGTGYQYYDGKTEVEPAE